jgi:hypothetical protein
MHKREAFIPSSAAAECVVEALPLAFSFFGIFHHSAANLIWQTGRAGDAVCRRPGAPAHTPRTAATLCLSLYVFVPACVHTKLKLHKRAAWINTYRRAFIHRKATVYPRVHKSVIYARMQRERNETLIPRRSTMIKSERLYASMNVK